MKNAVPPDHLSGRIYTFRGQRVILDADLARLHGVRMANEDLQGGMMRVRYRA